jgi:hypothetical protein
MWDNVGVDGRGTGEDDTEIAAIWCRRRGDFKMSRWG